MAFVPTAGVVTVELISLANGQLIENVWNVSSGSTPVSIADLDRIQAKFEAWRVASLRPVVSNNLLFQRWSLRDITAANSWQKDYTISANTTGSVAGVVMPNNVTVAIKLATGLAGRSYRGRTFHVGLTSGQVLGNAVTSAAQLALVTCYTALRTALLGGATADTWVVLSKFSAGAPRVAGVATPIASVAVDINLDSARRRLNARGV